MPGPTWLPTRPGWMPAWDEIYKRVVPATWPRRLFRAGSGPMLDLEMRGHGLSWVRELLEWILHCFIPAGDDEQLFLDRWEESLGIMDPPPTKAARVARIEASLRLRHTMTEDQVRAIFCLAFNCLPSEISFAFPAAADIAAVSTNELTNLSDQNYLHIYSSVGSEPSFPLADDLIRRCKAAWQRWSVGSSRTMRYGDGEVNTKSIYRWGRATIGQG